MPRSQGVTTRSKNATQHPGYVDKPPRKPTDPNKVTTKEKKAIAAKAKAAKAVSKKLGAARLAEYEQEAMEREDMLDATPRPNFTPAADRMLAPSSEVGAAESVVESEIETDEANPDKATYQPDAVSDDDSLSTLSTVTTKMSYAEAASPKPKRRAVAGAKTALAPKPAQQAAPIKMKAVKAAESDSATESDSPPPTPQPKAPASAKTKPMVKQTTTKRKAVEAHLSKSATKPDSPPLAPSLPKASSKPKGQKTTTASSQDLDPKTPAPAKTKRKRVASPAVSETEPEMTPPEPKQRSLRRLESYRDLGDIDKVPRKPTAVPKPKKSESRVADPLKAKDEGSQATAKSEATKWREWTVRQPIDEMDVDPPANPDAVAQKKSKAKGKAKAQVVQRNDRMIERDSDIEIVEGSNRGEGKAKTKKAMVKAAEGVEDKGWGAEFIVPRLPAGMSAALPVQAKRSHQKVDGDSSTNPK